MPLWGVSLITPFRVKQRGPGHVQAAPRCSLGTPVGILPGAGRKATEIAFHLKPVVLHEPNLFTSLRQPLLANCQFSENSRASSNARAPAWKAAAGEGTSPVAVTARADWHRWHARRVTSHSWRGDAASPCGTEALCPRVGEGRLSLASVGGLHDLRGLFQP